MLVAMSALRPDPPAANEPILRLEIVMTNGRRTLFVCGCPRSGTTAMWRLLTASPEVVLGVERFGNRFFKSGGLRPELFEEERFFKLVEGDTFYEDLDAFSSYYATARGRYGQAAVVGDKIPKLYERLEDVSARFPGARIVFMFRNVLDVAASYKRRAQDPDDATWRADLDVGAAVVDWTRAIAQFKAFRSAIEIKPVCYESIFTRPDDLDSLLDFVGLADPAPVRREHANILARAAQLETARRRDLSEAEVFDIAMRAPFGAWREIVREARGE